MTARQLNLFRSRRQRGVRPPPPLEFPVHCMIADTLRYSACPGWVWFHPPNGGERPHKINPRTGKTYSPEGARLVRMGAKAGVPDFVLIKPSVGRVFGLELKRKGKKPTDEQYAFGTELINAGGWWDWTDDYRGAVEILQRWGALPKGITVS